MRRNLLVFLTSIGIIFFYADASGACTTILAKQKEIEGKEFSMQEAIDAAALMAT